MEWERIGYAALCVIVPVAWGLLVLRVSNAIERRVKAQGQRQGKTEEQATMEPLDYNI